MVKYSLRVIKRVAHRELWERYLKQNAKLREKMSNINEIVIELNRIKESDCFYADADEILATFSGDEIKLEEFDLLFRFIEENPSIDYGTPGSMVHFMEHYYNCEYDKALKISILRNPTVLTLIMLNRVINVQDEEKKDELIHLYSLVQEMDVADDVKTEAVSLLRYQSKLNK